MNKFLYCNSNSSYDNRGFSLAELLVTVVIIGIASSISIVSYLNIIRGQAEKSASIAVTDWIDNIRKRAMQQNAPCVIQVSSSGLQLTAATGTNCGSFASLDLQALSTAGPQANFCFVAGNPLSTSVSCDSGTSSIAQTITFSPRGTTAQQGIFAFASNPSPGRYCTILLQPLGILRSGRLSSGICNTNL
jgi:prepilin-type N-terminal cleavage/methylation domain-containing protein